MNRIPVTSPASVAVFRRILTHGPLGRVDVSRATGLSQAAVTKAVAPLLKAGFVIEADASRSEPTVGRPINPLAVAHDRAHIIGVKITADRTYAVMTDLGANVRGRAQRDNVTTAVEDVLASITEVIAELRETTNATVDGIGVAVSGDVDRDHGVVRDSPLLGWHGVELGSIVHELTGLPVVIENDVRALTVTELLFGAGRDAESFALVTIGTGIGCGLFVNGKILLGAHGVSGEIGHLPLAPTSRLCSCGRTGCVEAVASTEAILTDIRDAHADHTLSIDECFALAHSGDRAATETFARAGEVIGAALAALVNLVGPSVVIIAGENVTEFDLYEDRIRTEFAAHAFGEAGRCEILLRPHAFEDWARGAAVSVIEAMASGIGTSSTLTPLAVS